MTFQGRDGYRSIACLEDALAEDVLMAEHLDGWRRNPAACIKPTG